MKKGCEYAKKTTAIAVRNVIAEKQLKRVPSSAPTDISAKPVTDRFPLTTIATSQCYGFHMLMDSHFVP